VLRNLVVMASSSVPRELLCGDGAQRVIDANTAEGTLYAHNALEIVLNSVPETWRREVSASLECRLSVENCRGSIVWHVPWNRNLAVAVDRKRKDCRRLALDAERKCLQQGLDCQFDPIHVNDNEHAPSRVAS